MQIDTATLNPFFALIGALAGGSASLVAAIYTQRFQNRLQRAASEATKRETVYADFVMNASSSFVNAYVKDSVALDGDEQRLIGLINRMRLFAPADVISEAEEVLKTIVDILLKPSIEIRQLAKQAISEGLDQDPLLAFSSVCRADLDNVRRAAI